MTARRRSEPICARIQFSDALVPGTKSAIRRAADSQSRLCDCAIRRSLIVYWRLTAPDNRPLAPLLIGCAPGLGLVGSTRTRSRRMSQAPQSAKPVQYGATEP